jgi:hypothetical protein
VTDCGMPVDGTDACVVITIKKSAIVESVEQRVNTIAARHMMKSHWFPVTLESSCCGKFVNRNFACKYDIRLRSCYAYIVRNMSCL